MFITVFICTCPLLNPVTLGLPAASCINFWEQPKQFLQRRYGSRSVVQHPRIAIPAANIDSDEWHVCFLKVVFQPLFWLFLAIYGHYEYNYERIRESKGLSCSIQIWLVGSWFVNHTWDGWSDQCGEPVSHWHHQNHHTDPGGWSKPSPNGRIFPTGSWWKTPRLKGLDQSSQKSQAGRWFHFCAQRKLGFTTEEKLQLVHVFLGELRKPSKRLWLGAGESYRFVSFRISPWQKQQHLQ